MTLKGSTSFYNTEEEFKKYLLRTSYYTDLQKNLVALTPSEARLVIDLGTGTGSTALQIANKCRRGIVHATDIRLEILHLAEEIAKREKISNIRFDQADMNNIGNYLSSNNLQPDVITALYAFHHVKDPLENKQRVVNEMYRHLKKGCKVIIADLYLNLDYQDIGYAKATEGQYMKRCEEAYNSVFWAVTREMLGAGKRPEEALKYANQVAEYAKTSEFNAMEGAIGRSKAKVPEYIITRQQLKNIFEKAGFKIIVFQSVNNIGEAVMMAEK